ncbi:MAG: HD domain-containing protein [Clostridiales bacterium]|nr:HD domain-containing protein [Clostridiales bacterium]
MKLPNDAKKLIDILQNAGFDSYAVGGCVRDGFMNRTFDDIDITTSASPIQTEKILSENEIKYIETGIKHGTVTAVLNGKNYEITTFRTDGEYLDSRHPTDVRFVTDISDDLARRDFTINAMAYNDDVGLVDLYGGRDDLSKKLIRAVGDADLRFKEDALRIMRAIRFASVLSFDIEENTEKAIFANKDLLKNVSAERINAELSKLLLGENVFNVLVEYKDIIVTILPEMQAIYNVPQNTKWHIYDVWNHTAKAVEAAPLDIALRYTMLLHDIGKGYAKTTDANGVDHFKGHQIISAEYASSALKRLKVSGEIYERVMEIVPIHDMHIGKNRNKIKKWMSKLGVPAILDLCEVKKADKLAQNPEMTAQEIENIELTKSIINDILTKGEPFTRKDLEINGSDLKNLGYEGIEIGKKLNDILDKVISQELENKKEVLLSYAKLNHT